MARFARRQFDKFKFRIKARVLKGLDLAFERHALILQVPALLVSQSQEVSDLRLLLLSQNLQAIV